MRPLVRFSVCRTAELVAVCLVCMCVYAAHCVGHFVSEVPGTYWWCYIAAVMYINGLFFKRENDARVISFHPVYLYLIWIFTWIYRGHLGTFCHFFLKLVWVETLSIVGDYERASAASGASSFVFKGKIWVFAARPDPTRPDPITLFKGLYLRNRMSDRQAVFFDEYHLDVKVVWHGYRIA